MNIENDLHLISEFDKKYCINVFNPIEVAFVKGKGVYLYDTEGKKYMDMIGGIAVNSLGHSHKKLTATIAKQSKNLIHCCNYYMISQRSELAYNIARQSFGDKCFFGNSGAEANEAAIKVARGYFYHKGIDKNEIITAKMSFHGRTLGTIAATGQPKFSIPFGPVAPGFTYVEFNDMDAIKEAYNEKTCAIMLELIQGESGVHPADKEYVKQVREFCTKNKILLIIDEVQTGIGRTGKMFCYQNYGIEPDIMTLAKGLGGGVPIGAMICTNEVAKGFEVGDHGSTFGGNPLCCAAANTVLEVIEEDNLLDNVNQVSEYLFTKLGALMQKYPKIKDVRGMGLLIGIEFDEIISAAEMKHSLFDAGFLVSSIGKSTIRIAPPLIISKLEARAFVSALEKILKRQNSIK